MLFIQCYQNQAVFHSLSIYQNMRIYLILFGLIRKKNKSMKNGGGGGGGGGGVAC